MGLLGCATDFCFFSPRPDYQLTLQDDKRLRKTDGNLPGEKLQVVCDSETEVKQRDRT